MKTGTTSRGADVWCMAYTEEISTAVWIGHDDYWKSLRGGATGGGWSCPIAGAWLKNWSVVK